MENSIVWNSGESGMAIFNEHEGEIAVSYSDIFGPDIFPGEGNINADPLFADFANGDFALTASSPCVDTGDPNALLDEDGTRNDMGAFGGTGQVPLQPRIVVPERIAVGTIGPNVLTIGNAGRADLTITSLSLPGWLSTDAHIPALVQPGETMDIAPDICAAAVARPAGHRHRS